MKRFGALLLSVLVGLSCSFTKVLANTEDGFEYTANVREITISGYSGNKTDIVIPSTLMGGVPVVAIGQYAFFGNTTMKSVTIPDSVTKIDPKAFGKNPKLERVVLGDGILSISTFDECPLLKTIDFGNSVRSINGFLQCPSITSLSIPDSVKSIESRSLRGITALETVTVSSGNTVYDSRDNCNAIIQTATNTLLIGCKNTTIPSSVTVINSRAFEGSEGLTAITIPDSVTTIGRSAFKNTGLTSITIPDGNTSIEAETFYGCRKLSTITLPASITTIGDSAFAACSSLRTVYFEGSREEWNAISIGQANGYLTNANIICLGLSVTLDEQEIVVPLEGTHQLTATVHTETDAVKTVTWSSENNNIATVDSNGLVRGVSAGTTIIKATSDADNTKSSFALRWY